MKISKITPIYFSPTGTSKKVAIALAKGFKGVEIQEAVDLTYPSTARQMSMQPGELAVIGLPVYAGRLPALAVERMKQIDGKNCLAVVAVLYGNREYEDALIELCELAKSISLKVVGACSFIGEHSFSSPDMPIAHGRPDTHDLSQAREFGQEIAQLLQGAVDSDLQPPHVPGNFPYKDGMTSLPFSPTVNDVQCTGCGICLTTCPTGAISLMDAVAEMDVAACIFCCACIKNCPESAVRIDAPPLLEKAEWLHDNYQTRKEPQLFL